MRERPVVTLSALPIFQPAQRASSMQYAYAVLGRIHAGLGFVLRGDIVTPSMVRARSRYSDAHTMHDAAIVARMCGLTSIGIGRQSR